MLTAPRSHAVAVFCSVMATGAMPALSQPMDRQPFLPAHATAPPPPTLNFFLYAQKFILPNPSHLPRHSVSFPVICFHPSPPLMADHLVAGKLTERKSGRGRQIGNIQSPPLKGCAQKVCQPSPEHPRASFPSSLCPPCCACT